MARTSLALGLAAALSLLSGAALATPAETATPPAWELRGSSLLVRGVGDAISALPLGCEPLSALGHGDRVHIACGVMGAVEVALGPPAAIVARRSFDGAVTGLFVLDGAVWVQLAKVEARPLVASPAGVGAPAPRVTPAPAAPPPSVAPAQASPDVLLPILERHSGRVIVGIEPGVELTRGQRVQFFVVRQIPLGGGETAELESPVAVGRVVAVGQGRAEVALGFGERVPVEAKARLSEAPLSASRWVSPRLPGILDLRFAFRPFLALGTVGFGMVNDLRATWRFESPVALHAFVEPLGLGFADEGNIVALAGNLVVTYDSALFEVGLGLGWSVINNDLAVGQDSVGMGANGSFSFKEVRDGLSIAQFARLGAIDGLNLTVFNTFLLAGTERWPSDGEGAPDTVSELAYGGTQVTGQIPLRRGLWLVLAGGGGRAGYAFGELGLRVLVAGNGDHGTLLLTPTIGGAGLIGETEESCQVWNRQLQDTEPGTCTKDIDYSGPMVGLTVEYRP